MSASDHSSHARVRPLRRRLLFLAASGLLPLMMVLVWGLDYLVEDRRVDAERSVLDLSRALATAVDAELRSVVALLNHMSTADDLERADLRSFQLSARRTAQQMGWLYVVLSDSEGRPLLRTSQPYGGADPTLIEPESMARVIETHVPVVSRVIDRTELATEAFAVRIPVVRGDKLVYVLSAFLPTDLFLPVLSRQHIPSDSVASVFDQVNHRLARSRQPAPRFPSPSLRALIERGDAQGAGITTTVDGVESYSGFTRLASWGWVVAVGTSVAAANSALYALLQAVAAGLAASLVFAIFLAWVLSRQILEPINALKESAAALGRGEPVQLPPLDIVELDDVAIALTEAAADRDRASAQIATSLRSAEEANRSKDQFLAVLGHELRNPLAPISTAIQLMAIKGDENTVQERRIIERQLVHVTRLVDDLLDISRITGRRLTIRREPVRLAQLLTQVVETMRQSLSERSLSLELAPGMERAWVAGDEVRLGQVFNNLLVNAIKFTGPGGSIRVKAAVVGLEVQVDVEDTGVGLSPTDFERIFELFYQAPQSSDRARGGLGLGLPIVRSLVEMQGGRVQAASAGPDQGSCLTVRLPLCEAPAEDEAVAPAPAVRGAGSILVVDDNQDAADTCAALLEISGYTVRVAYTPEGALEVLREFKPDVAILDIGLPGMSGYALAGLMKAAPFNYRGRLLALTGYGQAADVAASNAAGFDAHLTKPVAASELLQLVDKFSHSQTQPSEHSAS
jgi:signal transduction histidine kinase/ActR/RegA family two-component response regulator